MCRGRLCRDLTSQRCGHGKPAQAAPAARETLRSTVLAFVPFPVIAIITITTVYSLRWALPHRNPFPLSFHNYLRIRQIVPSGSTEQEMDVPRGWVSSPRSHSWMCESTYFLMWKFHAFFQDITLLLVLGAIPLWLIETYRTTTTKKIFIKTWFHRQKIYSMNFN